MDDGTDGSNTTRSGRVKGAVKAWQFLMKKKRPRQIVSSDDESSINPVSLTLTRMKSHNTFQFQGTKEDQR
jgi:hypothetical protein